MPDSKGGKRQNRRGGRQPRIAESVCGERVRVALMEARPAGLTTKQLVTATGLSEYYVRKGLQWIKEKAALENLTPLTWTAKDGYRFPVDVADWIAYERRQFNTELTRITRLITATVGPHATARPDDKGIQLILAQLENIRTTLEILAHGD
ncbi:hypothetical protein ACSNOI_31865 [Actinomadura kijaniata]|uniref:hypothetical protein n=1 Tax=Actinomadura kijaniata TaxID=46161 RepID=UPI003F1A8F84